jgi:hypothetical protein
MPAVEDEATTKTPAGYDDVLGEALTLQDRRLALRRVGDVALARADKLARYYDDRKGGKRRWAQGLRISALVFGTLAGLLPLVLPVLSVFVFPDLDKKIKDLLSISAICAGLSAAFIAFDKLFGMSTAWMRFVTALLDLRARRDAFLIAWTQECLRAGEQPTAGQLAASLDVAAAFLASLHGVVRTETQSWMVEFRNSLADLEKSVEASRAAAAVTAPADRGAIEVRVLDVASLDGHAWTMQVASQAPVDYVGATSAAITHIEPGAVRIAVRGKMSGKPASTERVVIVEPSKVAVVEVSLQGAPAAAGAALAKSVALGSVAAT